jgi:hypothetical protein
MLIAYVRQDTRFQIIHELEELDIRDFIYEELPGIEPGRPTIGRFEIVIWDEDLADKVEKVVLKRGTGYDPPDVTIIRSAVYAKNNG